MKKLPAHRAASAMVFHRNRTASPLGKSAKAVGDVIFHEHMAHSCERTSEGVFSCMARDCGWSGPWDEVLAHTAGRQFTVRRLEAA